MDLSFGWILGVGLFLLVLAPYLYYEIKRGKSQGTHVVHVVETSRAQRYRSRYRANTDGARRSG